MIAGARSRTASISQDTDYVILQSNPLMHWVPVPDEPDSTDDSSLDSITLHPIHRSSSQRSIASRCSIKSSCSQKHGVVKRPTSLLISAPSSPKATRNNQEDQSKRRSSRKSIQSLTEELQIVVPVPNVPTTKTGKLNKLKEKLLSGNKSQQLQELGGKEAVHTTEPQQQDSDGESTPLVSELSSPSNSMSDNAVSQLLTSPEGGDFSPSNKQHPNAGGELAIDIDFGDSISLMVKESSKDTRLLALSRQDAQDWENPETPV